MGMLTAIRSIFAARKTAPDKEPGGGAVMWPMRSDSGVFVNEETALGISAVYACATLAARSIGMLPWHVLVARSDGRGAERVPNHDIEFLLDREPNSEMTAMSFRESMMLSALLQGNGVAEIHRDEVGRPLALWPLAWDRVRTVRGDDGELLYEVTNEATEKVYLTGRDVFHLKGPTLDGINGLSVVHYARQSLGLSVAQERFAGSFIANGAQPSGVLKLPSNIQPEGMARLRKQVDDAYSGPRRAGRVMILEQGTSWEQISISPQDAEFIAQRRFSVEEVCRWFGCPPQKIADTSKQTFANFEQANLSYWVDGLLPWAVRLEQEANRKLIRRALPGRARPYTKLNAHAILRADSEKQTAAFTAGIKGGWLNPNEVRGFLDLPPREGGDSYAEPGSDTPTITTPQNSAPILPLRREGRR